MGVLPEILFRYPQFKAMQKLNDEALDIAKASLTGQTTNTGQRANEALKGLAKIGRLVLTGDKYALV